MIATPGQTVGPFFGYALPFPGGELLVPTSHPRAVRLHGTVRDGNGDGIPDALVELWQADEAGRVVQAPGSLQRDGYTFTGFGRTPVDATGDYSFTTLVPGAEDGRAPFFAITVFARGLLNRLFTRAYLPGDADLLAADPLLASLPAERRDTLVATPEPDGFRFDIVLQGDGETVFLHYPGERPRRSPGH
ncbi:Protocatechuate 3,4-dioxygenase alpha chain [metagenome]|uniref:Protocatechuate 3,4-dioxygenase alpha chain n=1 Tax=metagenome TaxID=256318 RepID=A0A2P2C9S4_9ZZZZ